MISTLKEKNEEIYLEGSILVEGATGVITNKLLAADVDGIATFGDDELCGGDME